jgi:Ca2+-binding RTX toxin-like protein
VISDWDSSDSLVFGVGEVGSGTYVETVASDYATALSLANNAIAGGGIDYVAVQIGSNVVVFADSAGDNGTSDDAVVLASRTLADIGVENLGLPLARQLLGGNGNDEITGGNYNDTISGGAGDDLLSGLDESELFGDRFLVREVRKVLFEDPFQERVDSRDLLNGGDGNDTLNAGNGDSTLDGGNGADQLNGWDGDDVLLGGAGNDDLYGSYGYDTLTGGTGADTMDGGDEGDTNVFSFASGDSAATYDGAIDVIENFDSYGRIVISGGVILGTDYAESVITQSAAAAQAAADAGNWDVYVSTDGEDSWAFIDIDSNNTVDLVIRFAGSSLSDFSATTFGISVPG